MLEKIFIFILFLGPLIFFHELGHFFFARLFGVRVEVFSIGFGPKIFKYVHQGTQYAISLIPLGGYVKMFGDDPFSEAPLSEEDKKVAFNQKNKWARFWIVFGGPLANLILAYLLYVGLLVGGEKVPETKVGQIKESSLLYSKGLRAGDVLIAINDEKITSFDDLNIKGSNVDSIKVKRSNTDISIPINLKFEPFIQEFVEIVSILKKPVFVNAQGERFIVSLEKNSSQDSLSLEELNLFVKDKFYLHKFDQEKIKGEVTANPTDLELSIGSAKTIEKALSLNQWYPIDLVVRNVVSGSPADKAKMQKDDILLSLAGEDLYSFEDLRRKLQEVRENTEFELTFLRNGKVMSVLITPETKDMGGKKSKLIGVESAVEYIQPKLVEVKADGIGNAIWLALGRTWDGVLKTIGGYKKLITREVSLNNIGGPLAIGKVASDSFNISLSMFFRLMAIISINLGVINLFPIPVLDGGHITFLFFELINGGPLSRRKLEIAQRFGISILFFLIFVALFNDFTKLFKF